MKLEFPEVFQNLFKDCEKLLKSILLIKLDVIRNCELELAAAADEKQNKVKSIVTSHFMGGLSKEMRSSMMMSARSSSLEMTPNIREETPKAKIPLKFAKLSKAKT